MKTRVRSTLFLLLVGAAVAFALAGFAGNNSAVSVRGEVSGHDGIAMSGMDMSGMDISIHEGAGTDASGDMVPMDMSSMEMSSTDMSSMDMSSMATLPELEKGMEDPYLDPYSLKLGGHVHADASSETEEERGVRAEWTWPDGKPRAGETKTLRIRITDADGQAIPSFDINNEKLLHLVMVSRDLGSFQHVHPDYKGEGIFELEVSFPYGGTYRLFADFMPTGRSELTRSASVEIEGEAPASSSLAPSEELTALAGGMEISLRFDHLMAKMQSVIVYTFKDAESGEPIRDLELYLGSIGHVIALDSAAQTYMHVHPYNWASSGPIAVFGVTFPGSGTYKLWGQFKRAGEVLTVPFVIQVP